MNRRLALKLLLSMPLGCVANSAEIVGTDEQILELDCQNLLRRISEGTLRAEQVCRAFLQQYERQRSLNAVTWIDGPNALLQARHLDRLRDQGTRLPALAGLPILVKDNIDTVGFPTSAGTESLKHTFPNKNAPIIERLLSEGAIVLGKANMHELSFGATSSNPTFGFVRNPYSPDLIPGGSSGGSAAAVAARIAPVSLGTDTVGSMRIPAAFCGVVGYRPSTYPRKLYSDVGVVPGSLDLDTIGLMGRSVADIAIVHSVITDRSPSRLQFLEGARIGVPRTTHWEDLDPEIRRVAEASLTRLRHAGAILVDVDLSKVKHAATHLISTLASIGIADLAAYLRTHVSSLSFEDVVQNIASRDVRADVERRAKLQPPSAESLRYARGPERAALCAAYRSVFQDHRIGAVIFPTVVLPPPKIRATGDEPNEKIQFNGHMVEKLGTLLLNTWSTAVLGAPGLSVPAGLASRGTPVGLELDGLQGQDEQLLALGRSVEVVLGRLPPPPSTLYSN